MRKYKKEYKAMYVGEKHKSLIFLGLAKDEELSKTQMDRKTRSSKCEKFGRFLCDCGKIHIAGCHSVKSEDIGSCGCCAHLPRSKDPWLSLYNKFKNGLKYQKVKRKFKTECLLIKEEYEKNFTTELCLL